MEVSLRSIPFLQTFPQAVQDSFAQIVNIRQYPKDTLLFLQGDKAETLYILLEGWIKLFRETLDGQEPIIGLYSAGDVFGQVALFREGSYPFAAQAIEDVTVMQVPAVWVRQKIREGGEIALSMLHSVADYMGDLELQVEHASVMTAPQRVGCFLLRHSRHHTVGGSTVTLPCDKAIIASYLGIQRETFSRALKQLQGIGIVTQGKEVTITDTERLRDLVCNSCSHPAECTSPCQKHGPGLCTI